jgi:IS30 family transposase
MGLVENHNGLLRQYYPTGESFAGIKEGFRRCFEEEINDRPRKLIDHVLFNGNRLAENLTLSETI